MKKFYVISSAALMVLSACSKQTPENQVSQEYEIVLSASIENTKTAFVPDGRKVFWQSADKIGAKYKKAEGSGSKYDNIEMTLDSGAGTSSATFKGKTASTTAPRDGDKIVFVYPRVTTQAKSGVIESYESFSLGNTFPKVQNTGDVLMDPNVMFGIGDVPSDWPTSTAAVCTTSVVMKNVMGVLDFTIKGVGSVKRLHITDNNPSAEKMWGDETINVSNGNVTSIVLGPSENVTDRTIIAEFNKPIPLTEEGAHVYITVLPREYTNGITVCVELTDGSYMVRTLNTKFTVKGNGYYSVEKPLVFVASTEEGKGYCDGNVYQYSTFTDTRDGNSYRYINAGGVDWMIDNLRYIPEDYTPSNSINDVCIKHDGSDGDGIWYPIVMNAAGTAVQFGNVLDASRYGYLYNVSLAVTGDETVIVDIFNHVADKSVTEAEAKTALLAYEGGQGICPAGWTVPSKADYDAFCTACGTTPANVNASALAARGFELRDFGYFMVSGNTATKGSITGYASNKLNLTEIILSTVDTYKQTWAIQFNNTNNVATTAKLNILSGASVRCIRK